MIIRLLVSLRADLGLTEVETDPPSLHSDRPPHLRLALDALAGVPLGIPHSFVRDLPLSTIRAEAEYVAPANSTCLLFPSRLLTEPRESFLVRDHYTSVARPKQQYKTAMPFKMHRGPEFLIGFLLVAWAVVCVCIGEFTDILA